jgi:hypothetical protein
MPHAFENDPTLSPFEVAMIVSWVDGGAIRGPEPVKTDPPAPAAGRQPDRALTIPCTNQVLPTGRLLAITPRLAEGGSAGFVARLPDGRREILGWIRDFEAAFAETYRLHTPLDLPPGTRLEVESSGRCSLTLRLART